MTEFTRDIVLAAVKRTLEDAAKACECHNGAEYTHCGEIIRAISAEEIVKTIEQEAL